MVNKENINSEIEYQTVILASLIHDIGKFLHRDPKQKGSHEYHSMKYVEELSGIFGNTDWFYGEMLKELVENHSTPSKVREEWRRYARIVFLADCYSSGERERDEEQKSKQWYKSKPLDSIFSLIKLNGKIRPIDVPLEDGRKNIYRHNLTKLDPLLAMPVPIKEKLTKDEIPNLVNEFKDRVNNISPKITFDNFFVTFLSLMEQYLWCVPSDTRYNVSDISLYDHLKASSALSACLYKFYFEGEENIKKTIKTGQNEFVLVGGDLRGIQKYIYDIANSIEGRISKRLRARSFFITTLVDVVTHKILHDLNLPFSCNLITAGGHLQILIPNTQKSLQKLEEIAKQIGDWLLHQYFGEINLSLNWHYPNIQENENKTFEISREGLEIFHFFEKAELMHDRLSELKWKKFEPQLVKEGKWVRDNFKMDEQLYLNYKSPCDICHKFPAIEIEHDEEINICAMCHLDRHFGKELANAKYLVFSRRKIGEPCFSFFDDYWVTVSKANNELLTNDKIYLVQILQDQIKYDLYQKGVPSARRFLANHIPLISDKNKHKKELCPFCAYEDDCSYKKSLDTGDPFTFSCLSALSVEKETGKGSQLIGILKMDIDHLGYLFGRGFKDIKEGERIDRVTISRYLTLSRMIDLFFCGWVQDTISKDERFNKIYTVFSGGDDLLVLGPWETIIRFSYYLYQEFRKYVCENESVKISAGIVVVKPTFPIARGATLANELLKASKDEGRDRLTLFGTTVEWEFVPELIEFADLLTEKMKPIEIDKAGEKKEKKSKFTTAFLYRLLNYRNMYLDFKNRHSIRGLLYCSKLIYDVNRNIYDVEWEKGRRVIKNESKVKKVVDKIFQYFVHLPMGDKKNALIEYINIPIIWALYKNRGGSNNGR